MLTDRDFLDGVIVGVLASACAFLAAALWGWI